MNRSEAPHDGSAARRRAALVKAGLWAFPLAVWLCATLFMVGDLGKVTDDYSLCERDVRSGELEFPFNPYRRYSYFWRPLHVLFAYSVGTVLWEHDTIVHWGCAMAHGVVTLLLWRLLRATGVGRSVSIAGALVFMVLPVHYEVVFWFSSCSTAISAALLIVLLLRLLEDARRGGDGRPGQRPGRFAVSMLIAASAICFYEQSGTVALAVPLLFVGARAEGVSARSALRRATAPTIGLLVLDLVYFALLYSTAPAGARGGEGSLIAPTGLPVRAWHLVESVGSILAGLRGEHIAFGGVRAGLAEFNSVRGLVWGSVLAILGAAWIGLLAVCAKSNGYSRAASPEPAPPIRTLWWILSGLVMFAGAWAPLALLSHQNVETRTCYIPLLGAVVACAHGVSLVAAAVGQRTSSGLRVVASGVAATFVVAIAMCGVVVAVGFQSWFFRRHAADMSIVEQLRLLYPTPPPGTVFMPIRLDGRATNTGYSLFDRAMPGAFETYWSAQAVVQRGYARSDLASTFFNTWAALPLQEPTAAGVQHETGLKDLFRPPVVPADPRRWTHEIPWELAIPFRVDETGRVQGVSRLMVEQADGRDLLIEPPLVHQAGDEPGGGPFTAQIGAAAVPAAWSAVPASAWRWQSSGDSIEFTTAAAWGSERRAVWMHPSAEGGRRSSAVMRMGASAGKQEYVLRYTIAEHDLHGHSTGASMVLTVREVGGAGRILARETVSRERVLAERRWMPIGWEFGAGASPAEVEIRLESASDAPPESWRDPVWMSVGMEGRGTAGAPGSGSELSTIPEN